MPKKPSDHEDEYVARQEYDRLREKEAAKRAAMEKEERQKLKDLHFMRCPKCGMNLVTIDYKGVDIDKCSSCEGVWLDAGEIDQVAAMEKGALDKFFSAFKK
jgi:hypothetical protein